MTRQRQKWGFGIRWTAMAIGLCCLTLASSCGGSKAPKIKGTTLPVFPVSGQLTTGGQPMADAQLVFYPVEEPAAGTSKVRPHATTEEDGSFKVSTYGSEDGAPAGKYAVTVSWKGSAVQLGGDGDERAELVPPDYRNPRLSKLKVEIAEHDNALGPWEVSTLGQDQASNATTAAN